MSKMMNDEVAKWSDSTKQVIENLEKTLDHAKTRLKYNQDLFNETMHKKEFNEETAFLYIQAMNSCIESIKSLETLLHATRIGKTT
jgi:hypothetical protein